MPEPSGHTCEPPHAAPRIDMAVSWQGTLKIIDFNGQERVITMSRRRGLNQMMSTLDAASA